MAYTHDELSGLIQIGTKLVLQLQEFIISDEIDFKVKDFSATNIVLIDAMTKTLIGLQFKNINNEQSQKLIKVYEDTLRTNYEFAKKIITGS